MTTDGFFLRQLPATLKYLVAFFVFTLSIGFFTGLLFVDQTTQTSPQGLTENYLGNEDNENAEVMIFKKSAREMLTIIHTHILSLSLLFLSTGLLAYFTRINNSVKKFVILEPFASLLLTFGGLYFVWLEIPYFNYVVMLSGILMTVCYIMSVFFIYRELFQTK